MMISFVSLSPEVFYAIGCQILQRSSQNQNGAQKRRFRAFFGVSPKICPIVWNALVSKVPPSCQPRFLLWALLFLKIYASEHVHSNIVGSDEEGFRKLAWRLVNILADLPIVSLKLFVEILLMNSH